MDPETYRNLSSGNRQISVVLIRVIIDNRQLEYRISGVRCKRDIYCLQTSTHVPR